jgi:hypothetical protein
MSAPSATHEARRTWLGDMATLAEYVIEVPLAVDRRPDVVRLHQRRPALLVGDAKATETPRCRDTRRRLAAYFASARRWSSAGFDVGVVLIHNLDPINGWVSLLEVAADDTHAPILLGGLVALDQRTAVSWVWLACPTLHASKTSYHEYNRTHGSAVS